LGLCGAKSGLGTWREGVINVELEKIVGAMGVLRVLHNIATGKVAPDRRIGETQFDGLVIISHGDIDSSKPFEGPFLDGCEVHVRHLDCNKLERENDG
jgi:hypothetical protein